CEVRLWDTTSGKEILRLEDDVRLWCMALDPVGGKLATGTDQGTVKLWDLRTGELRASLPGHKGGIYAVAFAPDGRTLASAGDDRTIHLWHLATGQEVLTLGGLDARVYGLAFSPDSRTLAAALHDGTVLVCTGADEEPAAGNLSAGGTGDA